MTNPPMPQAQDLIQDLVQNHRILAHVECPFSYHVQPGDRGVVVLAGDNASGKSLLLNLVGSKAYHAYGVEPIIVSMAARTQGGVFRAMTYGSESDRATGQVSVATTLRALGAIPGRLDEGGRTLVVLDEPDFGLAEQYGHAFGKRIGRALTALPEDGRWSLLLASHSRELVRGLLDGFGKTPTFVHTGQACSLDEWLAPPGRHEEAALDRLLERAREQQKILGRVEQESKPRPKP